MVFSLRLHGFLAGGLSAVFFRRVFFNVKMTASRDPDPPSPPQDTFQGPEFPSSDVHSER